MPKFIVTMREVHYQDVLVEAKNEKAAIKAAAKGQGEFVKPSSEFAFSTDPDGCATCGIGAWDVEKAKL